MKKTCLVIGYMNNNLGDDLFFQILFNRYKNVDFYMYPPSVLLDKYKKIYKKNKNVIFYDKEEKYLKIREDIVDKNTPINLFDMICERAKNVDFYVNIGGSIFIQNDNWKDDDRFKLKEIMKDKPSFIIGCNFGPGTEEYYDYYKEWFKRFDDICFRDKASYDKFKDLENARLADDIVLITSEKKKFHCINYKKNIGISVIDPKISKKLQQKEKSYYDFINSTIKYYLDKKFNITLFSFCSNDGDMDAIEKIINSLDEKYKKKIKIVEYENNIGKFIKKWKENKYIIGTRFHANILAIANDQYFLPIIYSDKTLNYLKNLSEEIKIVDIDSLKRKKKSKLVFNHVDINYNSDDQFIIIDNYLRKEQK
jgi:colanic acid/amylovoran biosynthesis protein